MRHFLEVQRIVGAYRHQTYQGISTWSRCERATESEGDSHAARGGRVCRACLLQDLSAFGAEALSPLLEAELEARRALATAFETEPETDEGDAHIGLKTQVTVARSAVEEWLDAHQ